MTEKEATKKAGELVKELGVGWIGKAVYRTEGWAAVAGSLYVTINYDGISYTCYLQSIIEDIVTQGDTATEAFNKVILKLISTIKSLTVRLNEVLK